LASELRQRGPSRDELRRRSPTDGGALVESFPSLVIALAIVAQVAGQSVGPSEAKRRCDELAASPWDDRKAGKGVEVDRIVVKDALAVCRIAAEQQPNDPRYQAAIYSDGRGVPKDEKKRDCRGIQ
jgi:hypothetical protein